MKRYKLKKDLPTFKAGDEFFVNDCGDLLLNVSHNNDSQTEYGITAYCRQTLIKFPNILTDWFEEILERPKTVWDLEDGDLCYIIAYSPYSDPHPEELYWTNASLAEKFRSLGMLYLSEEEARKAIAWNKARAILERDTKGFKPDYGTHSHGHQVYLIDGELEIDYCPFQDGTIRFATEEDAEESIDKHRKEWLTYLGAEKQDEAV